MTVDKVNHINKVIKSNKPSNQKPKARKASRDSVNISTDARVQAEFKKYIKMVKDTPNIRQEKIDIAKKNLESYFSDGEFKPEVLKSISEKIASSIKL
ncbi:MAG TPA: hypothetical protein VKS21_14010 [Spirochaetota bacterium]|nr:hypothetical protein [Spirochaetota bacterium]